MNHNWAKRLHFYIDPKLKTFDKAFHKEITQKLDSFNIVWSEEFNQLASDKLLPNIFLLLSDTTLDPVIRDIDHTLIFGASNMSFFGKKEFEGHNLSLIHI